MGFPRSVCANLGFGDDALPALQLDSDKSRQAFGLSSGGRQSLFRQDFFHLGETENDADFAVQLGHVVGGGGGGSNQFIPDAGLDLGGTGFFQGRGGWENRGASGA